MENYLKSKSPLIISETLLDKPYTQTFSKNVGKHKPTFGFSGQLSREHDLQGYLQEKKPIIILEETRKNDHLSNRELKESYTNPKGALIIPPLNTDIRFSKYLKQHKITTTEKFGISQNSSNTPYVTENYNPKNYDHRSDEPGVMSNLPENFSWGITTDNDSTIDTIKKTLIHEVSTQHACGSCWAVCLADTISDCFVVSGAVGWSPKISATYLMGCIPLGNLHNRCLGGNPGAVAAYLEREGLADTSCVDYSWCAGDGELCTSVESAQHFDAASLASKLNANIPEPCGCYFTTSKKYLYMIDPQTDVLYIDQELLIEDFRNTIKTHLLDFGPVVGGFAVLNNFFTGNFTDPTINDGVYFDRADYNRHNGGPLHFSDRIMGETAGLHAVSIVGWGVAKNIQYDNKKTGDVPYWDCRNSWGSQWGNMKGYFKIAMYPFNKVAQFDKQVMTNMGGPVGSMVLIRATKPPKTTTMNQIANKFLDNIDRLNTDTYYEGDPEEVREINRETLPELEQKKSTTTTIVIVVLTVILIFILK